MGQKFRKLPIEFWEKFLQTDEKIFRVSGYNNPQNDGVRETSAKHVPDKAQPKFPAQRMDWLGMTKNGTSKLLIFPPGQKVDGKFYLKRVLQKVVPEIKSRTVDGNRVDQKVLFSDPANFVFEHDFAKPHATKRAEAYLEEHVPASCRLPGGQHCHAVDATVHAPHGLH